MGYIGYSTDVSLAGISMCGVGGEAGWGLVKVGNFADTGFKTGQISDAEQAKGRHDRGVVMEDIETNLL